MFITNEASTLVSKVVQEQVSEHGKLLVLGLIDSISAMDLILSTQEKFNTKVPFEQVMNIFAGTSSVIGFIGRSYKG